jgi:hypothetical protein
MTPKTESRVHTTFNPVAHKKITTMLNPAVVFSRIFSRRLQLGAVSVTVAAKSLAMTKRTNPFVLICHNAVRAGEQSIVVVAFVIDRLFFVAMALCTEHPSLSHFTQGRM